MFDRGTTPLVDVDGRRRQHCIGAVGVLFLSLASACGPDRVAAIHVSVGTDIEEASWLELRTLAQDGSRVLSRGHTTWSRGITHTFNVVPRDNDLDANPDAVFELAAGSCAPMDGRLPATCTLVTRRVRVPYVPGVVRVVRVTLERACRGVPCAAPQTCVTGACTDERHGRSAGDAGSMVDVGPDVVAEDVTPDQVSEADGAPDTSADTCVRQCAGRACGSDGCGGSCGACGGGATCSAVGTCVSGDAAVVTDAPAADVSLICRSGAMAQTCRPPENCCASIGSIETCGCVVPLLGCIPRGGPGCD